MSIKADMLARDAMGREKHGMALQVENGRNAAVDAYQEALDLCAYSRQQYEKAGTYAWRDIHRRAVRMVAAIKYQLALETEGEG